MVTIRNQQQQTPAVMGTPPAGYKRYTLGLPMVSVTRVNEIRQMVLLGGGTNFRAQTHGDCVAIEWWANGLIDVTA